MCLLLGALLLYALGGSAVFPFGALSPESGLWLRSPPQFPRPRRSFKIVLMNHETSLPMEIDVQAVQRLRDNQADFLLLDCRETDEYETARIEGSVLLPMTEIQQRVGELDEHRGRHVVVYCHHGARSLRVANWLRQQGFEQAQSMRGGIDHWSQQIDPQVPRY